MQLYAHKQSKGCGRTEVTQHTITHKQNVGKPMSRVTVYHTQIITETNQYGGCIVTFNDREEGISIGYDTPRRDVATSYAQGMRVQSASASAYLSATPQSGVTSDLFLAAKWLHIDY